MDTGTPSITMSGSLLLVMDVPPRIRIEMAPPGSPLSMMLTPATLPWMSCSALKTRPGLNSSGVTASITPVRSLCSCSV